MDISEVLDAIDYIRKYNTETYRIEAETENGSFLKNAMIHFLVFQINMDE